MTLTPRNTAAAAGAVTIPALPGLPTGIDVTDVVAQMVRRVASPSFESWWREAENAGFCESEAVQHVARNQHGGLRFHDLRHSYGTWLADDGIVPNKLAKVMGHEDIATTMQLYVRRTEDHDAIRDLLARVTPFWRNAACPLPNLTSERTDQVGKQFRP